MTQRLAATFGLLVLAVGCAADSQHAIGVTAHAGKIWQQEAPAEGMIYDEAKSYCEGLTLGGHDDWRLPTISELRTLVVGCEGRQWGGACKVADPSCLTKDCYTTSDCGHCLESKGPADGCYWEPERWQGNCNDGELWHYFSSSAYDGTTDHFWVVRFQGGGLYDDGVVGFAEELVRGNARCVRDS